MSIAHAGTAFSGPRASRPALHAAGAGLVARGACRGSVLPPPAASRAPQRLIRRLTAGHRLSPEAETALAALCAPLARMAARADLIVEGEEITRGYVLEEGWACRYRMLADGRRQILDFVVPGDLVGGSGGGLRPADHSVGTLTACRVHAFQPARLSDARRRHRALQEALDWSVGRDLAIVREHVVNLGRRTARERVAHLALEMLHRLRLVGLSEGRGYDLPLTQEMIADALGLSIVHVNRTLRRLNRDALIRYRPGRIEILDDERLAETAEFDPEYLHQPDALD